MIEDVEDPLVEVAILGAGGFGREVAWLAHESSRPERTYRVVCFIDENENLVGRTIQGLPVCRFSMAAERFPNAKVVVGVGDPAARQNLVRKAENHGFSFTALVHSRVERSRFVVLGVGTVVCAGSVLTTDIAIGRHVHINMNCTVGHDVSIGDFSTLGPGVHLGGCVQIGSRVRIGAGAVIVNGSEVTPIVIGDAATVGAGSCVLRSVRSGESVFGVPARVFPQIGRANLPGEHSG